MKATDPSSFRLRFASFQQLSCAVACNSLSERFELRSWEDPDGVDNLAFYEVIRSRENDKWDVEAIQRATQFVYAGDLPEVDERDEDDVDDPPLTSQEDFDAFIEVLRAEESGDEDFAEDEDAEDEDSDDPQSGDDDEGDHERDQDLDDARSDEVNKNN